MLAIEKVYFPENIYFSTTTKKEVKRRKLQLPLLGSFLVLTGIAIVLILYLILTAQIIENKYRLAELQMQKDALIQENIQLTIKLKRLSSLDRIEKIARNHLKMNEPQQRIIIDSTIYTAQNTSKSIDVYHHLP